MSPRVRAFLGFAVLVWALVGFFVLAGCTYVTVHARDVRVSLECRP